MLGPPEHNGFLIEITRAQHPQQIIEDHQTDKEDADKSPIYTRRKEKISTKKEYIERERSEKTTAGDKS